ncbi:MAG: JAB domain-containing protein [Euryarchaeota archaeon]|nr:JAB domain-containing protein [Euryarchaeota archaeon]
MGSEVLTTEVSNFCIRELPSEERPRERLMRAGAESLSSSELLAIILRTGTQSENVLSLSSRILATYPLPELSRASVADLMRLPGIAEAKACQIVAAFELARRLMGHPPVDRPRLSTPSDCFAILSPKLTGLRKEHFVCLYLDTKNRLIHQETVSIGTLDASVVHPREVFQKAVEQSASAVVLAHNHPSGDPEPSPEDLALTRTLADAGRILGIRVLDHIICGDGRYVSLKERGLG